jgi:hypothetical protein
MHMDMVVKGKLGTIALAGAGTMMLVVGALHLVAPRMMMETPRIELTTVNHLHAIRAAYGGAYLGMAALFLLGLFRERLRAFSLLCVSVLFGGFVLGRLISIALDGMPVSLYIAVLAFEMTFAGLAFSALRAERRD